jgi:hypothetical protein
LVKAAHVTPSCRVETQSPGEVGLEVVLQVHAEGQRSPPFPAFVRGKYRMVIILPMNVLSRSYFSASLPSWPPVSCISEPPLSLLCYRLHRLLLTRFT